MLLCVTTSSLYKCLYIWVVLRQELRPVIKKKYHWNNKIIGGIKLQGSPLDFATNRLGKSWKWVYVGDETIAGVSDDGWMKMFVSLDANIYFDVQ
jgi:hypothetical protein